MRRLLSKVSGLEGKTRQRDLAVVEVLYGCGLRRGELSGLNLGDLRGDELRIRGKNGTERVVPVGSVARAALHAYMDGERAECLRRFNPFEPALFLGRFGDRLGKAGIWYLFHFRLSQSITPHQLRHACATHMLHNGASIAVLRDLLGHRSISTTRIYTEVKVEDVRKCLEKFHPREYYHTN
jgi:site-specific recombinase XerD